MKNNNVNNKIKIPVAEPSLGKEELDNVIEAVKSSWISSKGKFIEEFETNFAKYCGAKYGIATSNGTTALHLALVALGIGKGDEVIIPNLTYIATANAVVYCGAKPVFVDSHPEYWCIDPEKIEKKITSKTKAIIPVHLYGHPADMDPILKIAKKHNLYVVEDAAESHGAEYKGGKVGSFGDISCFSFFGNKIITTGEGGMCLTNDKNLVEKMRILRNQGVNPQKKYWHDVVGFNYRMTNIQAAIGVAQLKKMNQFIKSKRQIKKWYEENLKDLIEKDFISIQPEMPWAKNVYWMTSILLGDKFSMKRNDLMDALEQKGIQTRPVFYPVSIMPPYGIQKEGDFSIAQELSKTGINLPSSVNLSKEEVKVVCCEIKNLIN